MRAGTDGDTDLGERGPGVGVAPAFAIKGRTPVRAYDTDVAALCADRRGTDDAVAARVRGELASVRSLLGERADDLSSFDDVAALLCAPIDELSIPSIPALPPARPWPAVEGGPPDFPSMLAWADTNLKLAVDLAADEVALTDGEARAVFRALATAYALVVGQDDLASAWSSNTSVYLQERLLTLSFGPRIASVWRARRRRGREANRWMLRELRRLAPCGVDDHLAVAVSAGTHWSVPWTGPHRDAAPVFWDAARLLRLASGGPTTVAVLLDDDGEVVADLALVQALCRELPDLDVILVVNAIPTSVNASDESVRELLAETDFDELRRAHRAGRVRLLVLRQLFGSIEPTLLDAASRAVLTGCSAIVCKGGTHVETLPPFPVPSFAALLVDGAMSATLTGLPLGTPCLLGLDAGDVAFRRSPSGRLERTVDLFPDRVPGPRPGGAIVGGGVAP